MALSCLLWITSFVPQDYGGIFHMIKTLLTKLVGWLKIGLAKNELGQYPAILTPCLDIYIYLTIEKCLLSFLVFSG